MLAGPLSAQDNGGLQARLSFSQGLTLSSDGESFGQSNVGFSVNSATRTQTFAFDFGGAFTQRLGNSIQFELEDPTAALSYGIQSRQTAIETSLSFRQTDADALVENEQGLPDLLILDKGKREDLSASASLTFGREARFGGAVSLGYGQSRFDGTTSAELIDSTKRNAGVDLRFEIDRRITGTLDYNISQTDRQGGDDVRNETLRAGADLVVTPTLNAKLTLGRSRITTSIDTDKSVETGLNYGVSLSQQRPNGGLTFNLSSDITEAGRRTTATVGRSLETSRGVFSASLGLTESNTSKLRPLAELSYREELPRGSFGVVLDQNFSTTSEGFDALNSRFRFDWQRDLNRTASFSSDLTYQTTEVFGSAEENSRLNLGFSYSQSLTSDWGLTARFVHSRFESNTQSDQQENEIFVGLATNLSWRP